MRTECRQCQHEERWVERTNERFIELGRLPMSNREVGVGGHFLCINNLSIKTFQQRFSPYTHTHTHTHTPTRTRSYARIHANSSTLTHPCTHPRTRALRIGERETETETETETERKRERERCTRRQSVFAESVCYQLSGKVPGCPRFSCFSGSGCLRPWLPSGNTSILKSSYHWYE